jgi:hypothetical protein
VSDDLLNALTATISKDEEVQGAVVVTSFVIVAEFMTEAGERQIYTDTIDDQRTHTTLGLLSFAMALQADQAVRDNRGDE